MKETRMTTTSNYGFNQIDCTQDTKMLFKDYVEKDSKENWQKADTVIKNVENKVDKVKSDIGNLVTLDGESKQNFNFIRSNVEQDGLISYYDASSYDNGMFTNIIDGSKVGSTGSIIKGNDGISFLSGAKTQSIVLPNIYTISMRFSIDDKLNASYCAFGNFGDATKYLSRHNANKCFCFINAGSANQLAVNTFYANDEFKKIIQFDIVHDQATNFFTYYIDGGLVGKWIKDAVPMNVLQFGGNGYGNCNTTFYNVIIYNKLLTPQEIQHNFSVLNNSPSIKELHTTDSTGKTSILKLASDTDHVEDRSGRTQEQINRTFYKRMCKEIPSPNGEPVTVNNGEEGYVLSAEIKGQTVKNLFDYETHGSDSARIYYNNKNKETNKGCFFYNSLDKTIILSMYEAGTNTWVKNYEVSAKTFKEITDDNLYIKTIIGHSSNGWIASDIDKLENVCNIINLKTSVDTKLPFGLSSAQAIINNNGQSYPIYEPTIQGKTRILKAPKGTQNWVEIDASEERDTATYDYKLDSIAGDLGSVPGISDYIDRARKVKVINTREITLNGSENWLWVGLNSNSTKLRVAFNTTDMKQGGDGNSDKLKWTKGIVSTETEESIGSHGSSSQMHCVINVSKLNSPNEIGFKTWLQANPITVRYQLATPIEIPLTDEELKVYDLYKKVILLPFAEDKVTIDETGSATWINASDDVVFNGNEDWIWYNSGASDNDIIMEFSVSNQKIGGNFECAEYPKIKGKDDKTLGEGVFVHKTLGVVYIRVLKSKLETLDAIGLKKYLSQNNFTIRGNKLTPTVINIPKELVPTILTNKTNTLEAGGAVKAQSFKVTVPTTDGIKKEYTLTPINGWKGTAKANLLQTGDIELVLDLTIPSSFNVSICSLPTELRPKAERTVLGYNGNTPVVVKIGTDGTVKLPVTATGTVKLDDTYKL